MTMTHIANQRINLGGTLYMKGDPVSPSAEDLDDLPEGAVSEAPDTDVPEGDEDENRLLLQLAVANLGDDAFKEDGGIRAGALRDLIAQLGFEVTAEDVAEIRAGAAS